MHDRPVNDSPELDWWQTADPTPPPDVGPHRELRGRKCPRCQGDPLASGAWCDHPGCTGTGTIDDHRLGPFDPDTQRACRRRAEELIVLLDAADRAADRTERW